MLIMHGVSGSGKSWLSEQIISRYQAVRIRSDVERKRLHKLSLTQSSHSGINSGVYSQTSSNMTYQNLVQLAVKIINAGFSVIVDATFLQQQQRKLFFQQAEQLQVPFLIVHTQANKQVLLKRIKDRAGQQGNVSEANQAVLENQFLHMQPLNDEEQKHSLSVETTQATLLSKLWDFLDDHCRSGN
jgi:predicted kinase